MQSRQANVLVPRPAGTVLLFAFASIWYTRMRSMIIPVTSPTFQEATGGLRQLAEGRWESDYN